jgi:predicted RNA-binding protein with RPS1 domain
MKYTEIDSSLARGLARSGKSEWSAAGERATAQIGHLVTSARSLLRRGRPAAKVIAHSVEEFRGLAGSVDMALMIAPSAGRKSTVTAYVPAIRDGQFLVSCVTVTLNGRAGTVQIQTTDCVLVSQHAMERLHQRLGVLVFQAVRTELLSGAPRAMVLRQSARLAKVPCWGCPTASGLFVVADDPACAEGRILTWMHTSDLGRRWGQLRDDLLSAWRQQELQDNAAFGAQLLRLHGWLALDREHEDEDECECSPQAVTPASYVVGLNYSSPENIPRTGNRTEGTIVATRRNGTGLVATADGYFGVLSRSRCSHPESLLPGGKLNVEVVRVRRFGRNAFAITLAEHEEMERQWRGSIEACPVGATVEATVLRSDEGCLVCQFAGNLPILIPNKELSWTDDSADVKQRLLPGALVRVQVTRVNDNRRRLEGSLRACMADPRPTESMPLPGQELDVVLAFEVDFGFFVQFPSGLNALLHKNNMPAGHRFAVNDQVRVVVIDVDSARRRVSLACPECVASSQEIEGLTDPQITDWATQRAKYPDGEQVKGVVRNKASKGLVIVLSDGTMGLVPTKETDWVNPGLDGWRIGDSIEALVTGDDERRQQLKLSIRACLPWPFDVDDVDFTIPVLGKVTKVLDYGIFVALPQGVAGLLHRNRVPEGAEFFKGEDILVKVEHVDRERRRVALELATAPAVSSPRE